MKRALLKLSLLCLMALGFALAQEGPPEGVARIHYSRPDGLYEGWELHVWEDTTDSVTWDNGLEIAGETDWGVYFDVNLRENAQRLGFIIHMGDTKDPGPDMFLELPRHGNEVWIRSGDATIYAAQPLEAPAEGVARIHYYRPDGMYEGWELHVWEDTTENVTWDAGLEIAGFTDYGAYWEVNLAEAAETLGFIVHMGDEKDPGPDMFLNLSDMGNEIWLVSGNATMFTERPNVSAVRQGNIALQRAHWVSRDTILWDVGLIQPNESFALHYSPTAGLMLEENAVEGGETVTLEPNSAGADAEILARFPHLAGYSAFTVPNDADVDAILRSQFAVSALDADDNLRDATGLQIPGVLDDLYAYNGDLGVIWDGDTPALSVWAPTAQTVTLHLFDTPSAMNQRSPETLEMSRNDQGVWTATGEAAWKGRYYLYEVVVFAPSTGVIETNMVTDPYSLSLATNSTHSQIVDLRDAELKPEGWDDLVKPALDSFTDIVLYELHIRDFSVHDPEVPEGVRGTYMAFALEDSYGLRHLRALAEAGLTHLHLLPTFDIATINEDRSTWLEPDADLMNLPPDSPEQQIAISIVRDSDPFNWGYDPFHFTTPEGSYSTDPMGVTRIIEYREMVQALNEMGLRYVMDVVYNHTNAAGQARRSVFDRVVPGYYHRLDENGGVTTSTCCPNTATEHRMMEKFMIDSLLVWATEYKVDAFRFDLMGHHMLENMVNVREALDSLTLEEHGVDGTTIYVYGEGWNFGEVANNARGVNATQLNVGGLGIGTFNDRLRDAVRGGGPFDGGLDIVRNQGFINGLYHAPNAAITLTPDQQRARQGHLMDLIRVGLAANLADFTFEGHTGEMVRGDEVDYNGQPAGYTVEPQEHIVYVSKHDNQTLWDINQYKAPAEATLDERVRMQNLGLSIVMFSQGIPFFHAGSDMLRSKSLDRDSYNSGDHFNRLDFTYSDNNFGVGLPIGLVNRDNWDIMRPLLANPDLRAETPEITRAVEHFREILRIRQGSRLFRLETADDIRARLAFHNTGAEAVPGLIVMSLDDTLEDMADLDPDHARIVVVFNAANETQTVTIEALAGANLMLHPALADSSDELVRNASFDAETGTLSIPAYTTAVFVE